LGRSFRGMLVQCKSLSLNCRHSRARGNPGRL
jgi:hypothetical protein